MERKHLSSLTFLLTTTAFALWGCGPAGQKADSPAARPTEAVAPSAQVASPKEEPPAPITARVVDETEFAQVLASKRGSVVLVDYWATWCPACIKLFPHTLELAEKWKDRGLTVLTLSFDDPEELDQVVSYLEKFGARTENFVAKYGASEESVNRFAITNGALPHYKIYDRQGNLRKELLSGQTNITPQMIEAAVEEVLSE